MTALFLEANMSTNDDWYLLIGLLQFIVGVVQVLGAFFRTVAALITKASIKKLGIYWAIVLVYFSIWELFNYYHWNSMIWIPFAWLIAIWYCVKIVFTKSDNDETTIIY